MNKICITAFFVTLLLGCVTQKESDSAALGMLKVVDREAKKEQCIETFNARIKGALDGSNLSGDRDSILSVMIDSLPQAESEALLRTASELGQVGRHDPDSEVIPRVMSRLSHDFEQFTVCGNDKFITTAYVFADQLNVYLMARGIDTNYLFPSNDNWHGTQVPARLMVALVIHIQERIRKAVSE
ncbi:hypothetical protein ACW7G2_10945 [Luteimonas sp. A277]